jgi:hypothetical protein
MTPDEPLFAAFAGAVCQAIVANIIEMHAAFVVLEQHGLLSALEIENAKNQAPPELAQRLIREVQADVMKTMHEQYQILLAGQKGPTIQ